LITNVPRVLFVLAAFVTAGLGSRSAAAAGPERNQGTTSSPSTRVENSDTREEAIDHTIILGVGGAGELELGEGSFHPGANIFVEYEAIEKWLELELGASVLSAEGGVDVPIDLLLKKPFRLSRGVEFMVGVGPEIVNIRGTGKGGTFGGIEFALDFMFWPSQRVGLWLEPSYDIVFRSGTSHGVGSTGGVIFGW
jgi:hypothetical protein